MKLYSGVLLALRELNDERYSFWRQIESPSDYGRIIYSQYHPETVFLSEFYRL